MDEVIFCTIICKAQTTTLKRFCCFLWTVETRRQVPIQLFFSWKKASYFLVQYYWLIRCLNTFCAPTWNDHAIYNHLLQIFPRCQSYGICKSPTLKVVCRFTQIVVSSLFIQALPELLTTQRDFSFSSSDLDSFLAARKTANDFNLVPSALQLSIRWR